MEETNASNFETISAEPETVATVSETIAAKGEPVAKPPVTLAPESGEAIGRTPAPVAQSLENEVNWFLRLLPANQNLFVPVEISAQCAALGYECFESLDGSPVTVFGGIWIADDQPIEKENLKALRGQLAKRGIVRINKSAAWRESLGAGLSLVRIVGNSIYLRKD